MSRPRAPAPPDYAAANREGIETDIATLPMRLMAEAAARKGEKLYKTTDGRYTTKAEEGAVPFADFTDMGLSSLNDDMLNQAIEFLPKWNALNLEQQKSTYTAALDAQKAGTKAQLDQQLEYKPAFTQSNLDAERQAFDQSLELSEKGTRKQADLTTELLPQINQAGNEAQAQSAQASLDSWRATDPTAAASRDTLGAQLLEELNSGADLSPAQLRRVTQNVRGAQAARGNILGDGAAVDEAIAATGYGDQVKQQRTQNVLNFLGIPQNQMPQFQSSQAINPLAVSSQAGEFQSAQTPNFSATTQAPNGTNPFAYTNTGAGAAGAANANSVWNTQTQFAQNAKSPWAEMLGTAAGAAAGAFI